MERNAAITKPIFVGITDFDDSQEAAVFSVKAEFGGFYNLLGSRGSVAAFGADVDHHQAHVVHAFGGAALLEIGPDVIRVGPSAYISYCLSLIMSS